MRLMEAFEQTGGELAEKLTELRREWIGQRLRSQWDSHLGRHSDSPFSNHLRYRI